MISHFIKTSPKTAWYKYNRQKIMKSKQLENTQLKFKTLNGQIQIDETFIKEIHKGNFKDKFDKRKMVACKKEGFSKKLRNWIRIINHLLKWFFYLLNQNY